MMKRHISEISSNEALQVFESLKRSSGEVMLSSQSMAEMLGVPEELIIAKLDQMRAPRTSRHFVDRAGIVSAAIAASLVIGFFTAKQVFHPGWAGSPPTRVTNITTTPDQTFVSTAPAEPSESASALTPDLVEETITSTKPAQTN